MEEKNQNGIEVEIREHTDADFYPTKCPSCKGTEINRHTYKIRTIQDLGAPEICRRIRYEKITFICKDCKKTFGIVHSIIPWGRSYMPSIIKYAIYRVLKKGDSIRRVTSDLNVIHHVEVSIGKVKEWINENKREKIVLEWLKVPSKKRTVQWRMDFCQKWDCSERTVYRWVNKYNNKGRNGLIPI